MFLFPTPSTPTRWDCLDLPEFISATRDNLQVLLVVNLASFWGYTPQYYALNALTERVKFLLKFPQSNQESQFSYNFFK